MRSCMEHSGPPHSRPAACQRCSCRHALRPALPLTAPACLFACKRNLPVCTWRPAQAHLTRTTDRELLYLSAYLSKIAQLDSLEALNHRQVVTGGLGWWGWDGRVHVVRSLHG